MSEKGVMYCQVSSAQHALSMAGVASIVSKASMASLARKASMAKYGKVWLSKAKKRQSKAKSTKVTVGFTRQHAEIV